MGANYTPKDYKSVVSSEAVFFLIILVLLCVHAGEVFASSPQAIDIY